ncbi:MAG: NHL repeat-containing protein [Burkholderiaceae bacterium]
MMKPWRILVCSAAIAVMTACGGSDDGAPPAPPPAGPGQPDILALTAVLSPSGGAALSSSTPIVVQFSEAAAASSLELSGTFVALGPVTRWSASNEMLTLEPPPGGWPRGRGGALSVRATAASGAAMKAPLTANFFVPLELASGQAALAAIGQTNLTRTDSQAADGRSARTLSVPNGAPAAAPDGRLFIADTANNRVLGFPAPPAASDGAAAIVLGQADFASNVSGATRATLNRPIQVAIGNGRMAVTDNTNHRVLIWSSIPSASNTLPDVVVGQDDFTGTASGCSAGRLNFAEAAALTPDGKLLVADTENHRVLIWSAVPTANGTPPDLILGQSLPTRCRRNDDNQDGIADAGPTARTLYRPTGIWSDGTRIAVVDTYNNRVLVWNSFPSANFAPASLVVGQDAFTASAYNDDNQDGTPDAAPTSRTLQAPWGGVSSNGVQFAVTDSTNHRVLVWNTFPSANFQPADAVLGQADFSSGAPAVGAQAVNYPSGVIFQDSRLIVTDRFNSRVLVIESP